MDQKPIYDNQQQGPITAYAVVAEGAPPGGYNAASAPVYNAAPGYPPQQQQYQQQQQQQQQQQYQQQQGQNFQQVLINVPMVETQPGLIDFRSNAQRDKDNKRPEHKEFDMCSWGCIVVLTFGLALPLCCYTAACGDGKTGYERPCGDRSPCDVDRCDF